MLRSAPIYAYIPASDISRARKFYEETIGLKPKEEYAGGVFYECGGHRSVHVPDEQRWHIEGQSGVLVRR